jgi:NAD(P)-dependent dehydrogenase (short-subunit alcohol dehydrogenase family)
MAGADDLPTPLRATARTVLVVGGGGGIGSSVARLAARRGARVVIADLDAEPARRVAEAAGALFVPVDLEAIEDATAALRSALESVDAIVNAAGIAPASAAPEVALDEWERVLRINLTAPFFVCQALADRLPDGGAIVNVTSIEAHTALASSGMTAPAYAASKAGLELATRCLAVDLRARRIRVNAVAPGFVRTPMTAGHPGARRAWINRRTPLGRWADPEDVAEAVLFLIGDGARFVTGTTLVVDGGLTSSIVGPDPDELGGGS